MNKTCICPEKKKKLKILNYTHENSLVICCEDGTMNLYSDLFLRLQIHGQLYKEKNTLELFVFKKKWTCPHARN